MQEHLDEARLLLLNDRDDFVQGEWPEELRERITVMTRRMEAESLRRAQVIFGHDGPEENASGNSWSRRFRSPPSASTFRREAGGNSEMVDGLRGDVSGTMRQEKRGSIRTIDIQSPTPTVAAE